MPTFKHAWTDQQIDDIIGNLLRIGVVLSALVVLFGGIVYLTRHGLALPEYRIFHGEPSDLCDLSGIVKDAWSFQGRGLIQFGLVLLIATPIVRVAFTCVAFALQRDKSYVLVTLIVLVLLTYSLVGVR
ncbi:MAG TPA: DUF1634 domain-containing protein [Syntrophobacteraceae bacterium]|nr:DUF1634 domain-containing protein [Syntrophobacteraceae bacterium]